MKLEQLYDSLKKAPIVKKGDYSYVVHPITDGIPEIAPGLLREIIEEMVRLVTRYEPFDKFVTMEAMGIPLVTALSLKMNIPFTIIRKRSYGLPGEVSVEQVTGYSKSRLYINGLKKGDTVIIIDDVLSTGGTLKAVLLSLKKIGVQVKGVVIAVDKGDAVQQLRNELDIPIHSLVNIEVQNEEIILK